MPCFEGVSNDAKVEKGPKKKKQEKSAFEGPPLGSHGKRQRRPRKSSWRAATPRATPPTARLFLDLPMSSLVGFATFVFKGSENNCQFLVPVILIGAQITISTGIQIP